MITNARWIHLIESCVLVPGGLSAVLDFKISFPIYKILADIVLRLRRYHQFVFSSESSTNTHIGWGQEGKVSIVL